MRAPTKVFLDLTETPTAEVRTKRNTVRRYTSRATRSAAAYCGSGKVTSKSLGSRLALA
jgi:hypothetical protein